MKALLLKLQSSIDSNLPIIGKIKIHINSKERAYFRVYFRDENVTLTTSKQGNLLSSSESGEYAETLNIVNGGLRYVYCAPGEYDVILPNKSKLQDLVLGDYGIYQNIDDFGYLPALNSLSTYSEEINNITGNIESLSRSVVLNRLAISSSDIYGDLAKMLDTMVSFGRNSGTLEVIPPPRGTMTYDGTKIVTGRALKFTFTSNLNTYPRGWYLSE